MLKIVGVKAMNADIIEQAVAYISKGGNKPKPAEVVPALLAIEKQHKKEKRRYDYGQFVGTWQLGFVSGTKTVRTGPKSTPIKRPGTGRFLPGFTKIEITYTDQNTVQNAVTLGPVQLQLTGPTQFWPNTNSLAFDFTHIKADLGPLTLYKGDLRGGEKRNQAFAQETLKDQAFFTFFFVKETCIAARGKGGGLALWTASRLD